VNERGEAGFPAPINDRFFEDYTPGAAYEFGAVTLDESAIIAFANQYDPQRFHTDPVAARDSPYQGLIASGWQTAAVTMRLLVDHFLSHNASLGSPGVDELRWLRPVRPGDTLTVRVAVTTARRSRSRPDRGIVETTIEVRNQDREAVMTMRAAILLLARTTGD
jgi:acyl dehydratase